LLRVQVSVVEPEAYVFDEEVLKKAADLGKPGLVEIKQLQDRFIFRVEGTGVLPVREQTWVAVGGWCQGERWDWNDRRTIPVLDMRKHSVMAVSCVCLFQVWHCGKWLILCVLALSCAIQVKEILWQSIDILAKKLENLNAGVRAATGMAGHPMDQGY
jgi:hypothetical protein